MGVGRLCDATKMVNSTGGSVHADADNRGEGNRWCDLKGSEPWWFGMPMGFRKCPVCFSQLLGTFHW